jgi:hypothetical protein
LGSQPDSRSEEDAQAGEESLGVAARWLEARMMAATGQMQEVQTLFGHHQSVEHAAVLLAMPALISQGLLQARQVYQCLPKGYYGLEHILLLLANMALLRIHNPEQLKTCKPGELGKIIGLDRVPEVKCLREKLSQIVLQNKAEEFERHLSKQWIEQQACLYFYIDGHVRIYHGQQASLQKKFVSRQKLCLAGTTEYWVNDHNGQPFMFFIGDLNERLKDAIEQQIVPALIEDTQNIVPADDSGQPRFTIIFDRECYEPAFFARLWKNFRIAVITYRKHVKETWALEDFKDVETQVNEEKVSMQICEKQVQLNEHAFREIRKLSSKNHQTSVITTHPTLEQATVAAQMFSRWSQENFFKYMIAEFDFDKMINYGTEVLDQNKQVVNPAYSILYHMRKKLIEKRRRLEAQLFEAIEKNIDQSINETKKWLHKQAELKEKIEVLQLEINLKVEALSKTPSKIKLADMSEEKRYNRLKKESKMFMNIMKMIAYRAETVLVNLIRPYYNNHENDRRQIIQTMLSSSASLEPDYEKNILKVTVHSQSTPRANKALQHLCDELNQTETSYPQTNLKLVFVGPVL